MHEITIFPPTRISNTTFIINWEWIPLLKNNFCCLVQFDVSPNNNKKIEGMPTKVIEHLATLTKDPKFKKFEIWWDSLNGMKLLICISTRKINYVSAVWR